MFSLSTPYVCTYQRTLCRGNLMQAFFEHNFISDTVSNDNASFHMNTCTPFLIQNFVQFGIAIYICKLLSSLDDHVVLKHTRKNPICVTI